MGRQFYWKEYNNNSFTLHSDQFIIMEFIFQSMLIEDIDYVCEEFSKFKLYFLKIELFCFFVDVN